MSSAHIVIRSRLASTPILPRSLLAVALLRLRRAHDDLVALAGRWDRLTLCDEDI